jgi:hypothetical protein
MTSHPQRPRDTNQFAKSIIDIATKTKNLDDDGPLQDMKLPHHTDEGARPSGPPRFDLKGRASPIQKRSLQPVMEVSYAHQANERIH